MPRKQSPADTATVSDDQLPTCSGAQLELAQWLRDLLNSSHLFDSDVAYFLHTASVITSQGKTAVTNIRHGILLDRKIIQAQNYNVLNPPPLLDEFNALWSQGAPAGTPTFPADADPEFKVTDQQLVAPDRILQVDMKLRNNILALITSRGRRNSFAEASGSSGCQLLANLIIASKLSDSAFLINPHVRRLKANLHELLQLEMTQVSQQEFDDLYDQIEEVNSQLDKDHQLTEMRRCDHYLSLIYGLQSQPIRLALDWDMKIHKIVHGDLEKTVAAITRVLTSEMVQAEIDGTRSRRGRPGRSLKASGDPRKSNLDFNKPPPTPCRFCGKMHWSKKCWKNPDADEETASKAPAGTPAALAHTKRQETKAGKAIPTDTPTADEGGKAQIARGFEVTADELAEALSSPDASTLIYGHLARAHDDGDQPPATQEPSVLRANTVLPHLPANLPRPRHVATATRVQPIAENEEFSFSSKHSRGNSTEISYSTCPSPNPLCKPSSTGSANTPSSNVKATTSSWLTMLLVATLAAGTSAAITCLAVTHAGATRNLQAAAPASLWHTRHALTSSSLAYLSTSTITASLSNLIGTIGACLCLVVALALLYPTFSVLTHATRIRLQPEALARHHNGTEHYFNKQRAHAYITLKKEIQLLLQDPQRIIFTVFVTLHLLLLRAILCPLARLLLIHDPKVARINENHMLTARWSRPPRPPTPRLPSPSARLPIASALMLTICHYGIANSPSAFSHLTFTHAATAASVVAWALPTPTLLPLQRRPHTYQTHSPVHAPLRAPNFTTAQPANASGSALLSKPGTKASPTSSPQHATCQLHLVIDSGATYHVHHRREDLVGLRPCRDTITGIDHHVHACPEIGDLPLLLCDKHGGVRSVILRNVRLAPTFSDTLISVEQLWNESRVDTIFRDTRTLRTVEGVEFPFKRQKGLYILDATSARSKLSPKSNLTPTSRCLSVFAIHSSKSKTHVGALSPDEAAAHMHRRLHAGHKRINNLPRITADAPETLAKARHQGSCRHCLTANAPRHAHKEDRYKESAPGRLIHADIAGPFLKSKVGHFEYLLVLVDDHSRFKFAIPLVKREDAPGKILSFVASFNKLARRPDSLTQPIGSLHTDGAGEFVSHKFRHELSIHSIDKTESPAEVHALNGVAERAIKSIFEQVRSDLVASGAPRSFWPYAVAHATDILNRTTTPPHGRHSCYESLTGDKPRIMSIMPFGCRAFAVRPSAQRSKTKLDDTGREGIHLGRSTIQPGAYLMWVPHLTRIVSTSEMYFDETLMPWRAAGDQRVDDPVPLWNDADSMQPPTLPESDEPTSSPSAPLGTLASEFERATRPHASLAPRAHSARLSRRVLILFSGPYSRPDGLGNYLNRLGLDVTSIDNNESNGGNARDDLLDDNVYDSLLRRAQRGEFLAIFAAPPCSTFSVSRLLKSPDASDGGPPPVRRRASGQVRGSADCPAAHRKELRNANELVARTCSILRAGFDSGTEYIIENPADRGDPSRPHLFIHHEHAPLWLMPDLIELSAATGGQDVTFPQCALGAPYRKETTLLFSPGLAPGLRDLDDLHCTHRTHAASAGGSKVDDTWNSAAAAAYPAMMNLELARAINTLVETAPDPVSSVTQRRLELAKRLAPPIARDINASSLGDNGRAVDPVVLASAPTHPIELQPPTFGSLPPAPERPSNGSTLSRPPPVPIQASPAPRRHQSRALAPSDSPSRPDPRAPPAAKIINGQVYSPLNVSSRTRSRAGSDGSTLLVRGLTNVDSSSADPRNRVEAMKSPDADGWTAAEDAELKNHHKNGSFELIDKSEFESLDPRRRLVKLVWVYKKKRNGKLKARLCVQGCCQQPGVDYDQTHCATMRGQSLRMLSAVAAQHNLRMRRWDFVSAYLQGDLEPGEVVYCHSPPGPYGKLGADHRQAVWKVTKPIYGMAQAGRRWQRSLFPWLSEWGLEPCSADPCVFHLKRTVDTPDGPRDDVLVVGCYVDDLFILYNNDDEHSLYHQFTKSLVERWEVDDEGEISDLLNIEISREGSDVVLRQRSYIDKMVARWLPDGVPSSIQTNSTPHLDELPSMVLDATCCSDPVDPDLLRDYQSLVGALLYAATNTRPDIAYAVGMLCRAMSRPSSELFEQGLRVLAYLSRHRDLGLRYEASPEPLAGMADADWAVRHSTSGFVFSLSRAAISWGSKRQPSIALSSCEAEIMAASEAAKEAVFLDRLHTELGFREDDAPPMHLSLDNKAAIDSAYNPENHARTKHIDRRHYFIRELVENGTLVVPFVRSDDNLADFFTKPLKSAKYFALRNKIMNVKVSHAHVS